MEGVRILAQSPVYDTVYSWGWSWPGFTLGIFAVVILIFIIFLMYNSNDIEGLFFLIPVGVVLGIALVYCFSIGNSEEVYSHEEYKVIIDDSVSLNDFYEKYEVISREGEIYTVIEREQG